MPQDNNTKEYFEKLKVIEKFCRGDVHMARKILKGEHNDVLVFKGRFKDEGDNVYGLFLIFLHELTRSVIGAYSIITSSSSVYRHKPYDEWRSFFMRTQKEISESDPDERSETFTAILKRINELKIFDTLIEGTRKNDIATLTDIFRKITEKYLSSQSIQLVLDFEHTNTLLLHDELGIGPIS